MTDRTAAPQTYRERFDAFGIESIEDRRDLVRIHKQGKKLLARRRHMDELDVELRELADLTDIPSRRIMSLVKKYGPAINAEYEPSDYSASGAGAFGRMSGMSGTANYLPATVVFHRSG